MADGFDFAGQVNEKVTLYSPKFNFASIDEAMANNYKLIVKTREDNLASYYKIVRVEREVMEQAQEALINSNVEPSLENIRILVRGYYRNNIDLSRKLNEEEMNEELYSILEKEAEVKKYPVLRDIVPDNYIEGKEYKVLKKKYVSNTFGGNING